MGKSTVPLIVSAAFGYALAITLMSLSVALPEPEEYSNLMLIIPYFLTPAMLIFLSNGLDDGDFWCQFSFFMISLCFVTAFAMPIVFFVNGFIGGIGIGLGLGSSAVLYVCFAVAAYFGMGDSDYY